MDQTITVTTPAPSSAPYNSQFTVAATASSGLTVSYSSGTPAVCTNSGATFTMVNGTGTCTVRYDQAGNATYNAAPQVTNSVTATKIAQATVTVSAPASASYGQTGLSATASGGSGTGAYSYSAGSSTACTVNSSTGTLTITSGTGTCSITATRAADTNYNVSAASAPANVTITKATQATVTVSAPANAYYGQTGLSATASGGSGTGAYSYDAGSSTACSVNSSTGALTITSGTGTCSITATRAADANYNVSAASTPATVTITKATPTVTAWPTASAITYGQTLASSTLSGGSASTTGTFAFTTPATAPNAGTASQGVTFTPTDTTNYNTATGSVSVTVAKADPSVTAWPTASGITYGQTLASSTLTGGSSTPAGTFAFTAPATAPDAGTASQGVTFTPADTTNYNAATGSVSVTVAKADPSVTAWPTASAITYGQTLAASTLSGGSSTPAGTFAFTTPATAPTAGTASQGVTFTPTDTANYNTATGSVSVTVAKADPSVTAWPTASGITYGQTLASSTLSGGSSTPAGTFAFTAPATAPDAGTASQGVTFTPADTTNYNAATGSVSVTVAKADPSVTAWPTASAITYGQTLAASTLSGGSSTPSGTFAFTAPATAPDAGTASQGVTFTPADTTNYNAATGSVSVTVNKADQAITFGALATRTYGDPSFTLSASGGASGNAVTFASSNAAVATVSGTTVTIVGAGITTITASQAGNANYNAASDVYQSLTVDKANQTITFAALPAKNVGDADFAPGGTASSTLTVTYASSNTAVATIVAGQIHIVGPGTTDITASQAGDANFNAAADVVQPLTVTASSAPHLNMTINGKGSVNSNPAGIACDHTGGQCSSDFTAGPVVLTAASSWNYDFAGWLGGDLCNGTTTNPCTVNVSSTMDMTATFTARQLVRMQDGSYKASIQEAYGAAAEGDTLKLRDQNFTENLDFNSTSPVLANVNLDGGYNADYTAVTGSTTITGSLTLTSGGITVSNIIIQ